MPSGRAAMRVERLAARPQEVLLEQQVLGRVAGHRQLREQRRARRRASRAARDVRRGPWRALPSRSPTRESIWASARRRGAMGPVIAHVRSGSSPRARAEPCLGERLQLRVGGTRRLSRRRYASAWTVRRRRRGEDHHLPGGGQLGVERAVMSLWSLRSAAGGSPCG